MIYNYVLINHISGFNCFQQRLRADINFLSIVSAWQVTCCETEIVFKDE